MSYKTCSQSTIYLKTCLYAIYVISSLGMISGASGNRGNRAGFTIAITECKKCWAVLVIINQWKVDEVVRAYISRSLYRHYAPSVNRLEIKNRLCSAFMLGKTLRISRLDT